MRRLVQFVNTLRRPETVYLLGSLLVLGPLCAPGFVLTMDMVFTPELRLPSELSHSHPLFALLHTLNWVIPADVIQKVLLFAILLSSGLGAHRLIAHLAREQKVELGRLAYFAGVFYMINPFVYSRFMAGQYLVLAAYALMPWVVWAIVRFWQRPSWRAGELVALLTAVMGAVSIHGFGFVMMIMLLSVVFGIRRYGWRVWKMAAMALMGVLVLCSYWLVPVILGQGHTAEMVARFTAQDVAAFATLGDGPLQKFLHVASLQGFWLEGREFYTLPQEVMPLWPLFMLMLWLLVAFGILKMWQTSKRQTCFFGVITLLGLVLASGAAHGLLQMFTPIYAGYREPQKFVVLVALGYMVFVTFGAWHLLARLKDRWPTTHLIALGAVASLPFALAAPMFWGFSGQLQPRQYPEGWRLINERLNQDTSDFKVLSLPWHHYMSYGFAGRLIANPTPEFFDKPVVVSHDPEIEGAVSGKEDRRQEQMSNLLKHQNDKQFAATMATYGIKYIVVAKELDYQQFDYLARHPEFTLVVTTDSMLLYRNNKY